MRLAPGGHFNCGFCTASFLTVCGTTSNSTIPCHRDLLSEPDRVHLSRKSYHLHVWRVLCCSSKHQDFQKRSLGSQHHPGEPLQITCITAGGFTSPTELQDNELIHFVPQMLKQPLFFTSPFDSHGLSPQTVKGYLSCLNPVLRHTGRAAVIQDRIIHQTCYLSFQVGILVLSWMS